MKKVYIKVISKCEHCPDRYEYDFPFGGTTVQSCSRTKKLVTDYEAFPEWCPLKDYIKGEMK